MDSPRRMKDELRTDATNENKSYADTENSIQIVTLLPLPVSSTHILCLHNRTVLQFYVTISTSCSTRTSLQHCSKVIHRVCAVAFITAPSSVEEQCVALLRFVTACWCVRKLVTKWFGFRERARARARVWVSVRTFFECIWWEVCPTHHIKLIMFASAFLSSMLLSIQ